MKDKLSKVPTELHKTFGKPSLFHDYDVLRKLFTSKEYSKMIFILKQYMGVTHDLRVGFVNSGRPKNAPAWIRGFAFDSQIRQNAPIQIREIFLRK